jgi:glycosyltransferase involved in cell wall biosynthesis
MAMTEINKTTQDGQPEQKKIRVAFVGQKGIPAKFGGVEYHVDRIGQGLVKKGIAVEAYVRNWYTDKDRKEYAGIKLIHLPTIKTKHLDASVHSLLCSLHAIFSRADIIHYQATGPSFFCFLPRLFGKKVIATVHRLDWATEKWKKPAKFFIRLGERISAAVPQLTVVVSRELKDYMLRTYKRDTIHIPNGFDFPQSRSAALIAKKHGLQARKYVLFMGRLTPEKRVDWLIRAFLSLKDSNCLPPGIKLVIAGGTSATDAYVRDLHVLADGHSEIIFTGYVSGQEKEELLSNALVFVLPSYLEGFPIVLLEAKSYGLCSLVSNILPHKEAMHDNLDGKLFESNDFSDLTDKLEWLLSHPDEALRLGERAREEITKRPSWEEVIEATENAYRHVLGG